MGRSGQILVKLTITKTRIVRNDSVWMTRLFPGVLVIQFERVQIIASNINEAVHTLPYWCPTMDSYNGRPLSGLSVTVGLSETTRKEKAADCQVCHRGRY